jgi:hypothetical protein
MSHALSLLRGSLKSQNFTRILRGQNALAPSGDEGLLIGTTPPPAGYGLLAADEIPAAGKSFQGGTYFVTVLNDPLEASTTTDLNGRVLVRCRSVTSDGATAQVEGIVGATPFPAVAANGNVTLSGSAEILGACGGAHANGNISAGGHPIVSTQASATGTATGNFELPNGSNAPKLSGQPPVPIPILNPVDHCATADYRLTTDGKLIVVATGLQGPNTRGWVFAGGPPEVKWDLSGNLGQPGTYCVQGNAKVSGNAGTELAPLKMSIIATGSIEVSGNPFMTAEHEDGIMFLAGGDVAISGNPGAGAENFQGMIYAAAQCKVSGNPEIFGQLLCANGAQPAGSINITTTHDMSGNFSLTFDCSANVFNKRRVLYWYPRIGT